MHQQIRAATMTDVTATKTRVDGLEILKQNSSSATENITILSTAVRERGDSFMSSVKSRYMADNLRPHQQCPRETEDNSHRFQTKDSVGILVEEIRLPKCAQLGTKL